MWPRKHKELEEKAITHKIVWDDSITAKEVMDLLMFHVSMGGTPACYCKPSQIPSHLKKFFEEAK